MTRRLAYLAAWLIAAPMILFGIGLVLVFSFLGEAMSEDAHGDIERFITRRRGVL